MEKTVKRTFPAKRERITEILDFVRTVAHGFGLPEQWDMPLSLVVDETVVNICDYAYPHESADKTITIILKRFGTPCERIQAGLMLVITDHGVPFNPLEAPLPNVHLPLEERNTGGLGVLLIRQFASEIRYDRRDDQNELSITLLW